MSLQQQATQTISLAGLLLMGTPSYKQAAAVHSAKETVKKAKMGADQAAKHLNQSIDILSDPQKYTAHENLHKHSGRQFPHPLELADANIETMERAMTEEAEAERRYSSLNPSYDSLLQERAGNLARMRTQKAIESLKTKQEELRRVRSTQMIQEVNPEGIKKARTITPEGVSK